jgi:hypothetical protein
MNVGPSLVVALQPEEFAQRATQRNTTRISNFNPQELPNLPLSSFSYTMKLSSIITSLLLPLVSLAAKKSSSDRFAENYSKNLPLKLDDDSYQALTSGPRDYAVSILLTALEPRFGCAACRDFQPEWEILARSWQRGDKNGESRVLFATLDFVDGKSTFQSVGNALPRRAKVTIAN